MTDATTNETAPPTETEKTKREKREMPCRIMQAAPHGLWKALPESFPGITEAERWIDKNGIDGAVYWPLRGPAKPVKISPRRVEEVEV